MPLPLILDTDIGTDVDDALALAFALRHPGLELRAVTTVAGDTRRRAQITARLLRLAGRSDIEVAVGLTGPEDRPSEMGHEGEGLLEDGADVALSERDAVSLLVEETGTEPVTVATVGPLTNLAAALDREPGLTGRIDRLAVMGGVFARPTAGGPQFGAAEHNLNVDRAGSLRALNAGVPTLFVPLDVTMQTVLTVDELERLRGGDALCRALVVLTERWARVMRGFADVPDGVVAVLHDPLTLAALVEPGLVEIERLPVTVAEHEGEVRTFIDPAGGRPVDVVRSVEAAAFTELWTTTVLGA